MLAEYEGILQIQSLLAIGWIVLNKFTFLQILMRYD